MTEDAVRPRNISDDTWATTCAVIAWGRSRWANSRVITELVFGKRRIDVLFVQPNDIVGVEIKGKRDTVSGDRLKGQLREFNFYVPELWLAVHEKHRDHNGYRYCGVNRLVVCENGTTIEEPKRRLLGLRTGPVPDSDPLPIRDEMCCSRLLELLWNGECLRIAGRAGIISGPLHAQVRVEHVRKLLARLLTGNDIIREVCTELRERPLVGVGSDKPVRGERNAEGQAAAGARSV